jgi:hypothetical protein
MDEIINFLKSYDAYFLIGLVLLSFILLICCISLFSKIAKIKKSKNAKLAEGSVGDIVDCITDQASSITKIEASLQELTARQSSLSNVLEGCTQNVGMVRFNAFEDVGGEQSFAMAMLDANKNGVIISSIYGRQDTRLYAKAINAGESERTLSEEERNALLKALS